MLDALEKKHILPLFLVHSSVLDIYKKLVKEWKKGGVATIASDGSNLLDVVKKEVGAIVCSATTSSTSSTPKPVGTTTTTCK